MKFFNLVSGQSPITVYMKNPEMKLIALLFHCDRFDRNETSFEVIKCYVNATPK